MRGATESCSGEQQRGIGAAMRGQAREEGVDGGVDALHLIRKDIIAIECESGDGRISVRKVGSESTDATAAVAVDAAHACT